MGGLALTTPPAQGVFMFKDHKISRANFLLPENCQKVSTPGLLLFLKQQGFITFIPSASEVQARALRAGRAFSRLRFPPDTFTG